MLKRIKSVWTIYCQWPLLQRLSILCILAVIVSIGLRQLGF